MEVISEDFNFVKEAKQKKLTRNQASFIITEESEKTDRIESFKELKEKLQPWIYPSSAKNTPTLIDQAAKDFEQSQRNQVNAGFARWGNRVVRKLNSVDEKQIKN